MPRNARSGWATAPQDIRERTCEYATPGLSVLHALRVARHPDPTTVSVTRTHEATVEWTTRVDLPAWLRTVARIVGPYEADRFDDGDGPSRPDPGPEPGSGSGRGSVQGSGSGPGGAAADGRFRAAPVEATVRPPGEEDPPLSDPYHYWNTPLARLLADDAYPEGVTSLRVTLQEGPDALATTDSIAGVEAADLPGDRERYARVGLEFSGRERFRRPATDDAGSDDEGWEHAGERTDPATDALAPAVEASLAPAVRETLADPGSADAATGNPQTTGVTGGEGGRGVDGAVRTVAAQVRAVWAAFRRPEGDPYAIPEAAVEAATTPPEDP